MNIERLLKEHHALLLAGASALIAVGGMIVTVKEVPAVKADVANIKIQNATFAAQRGEDTKRLDRIENKLDDLSMFLGMEPRVRRRRRDP